MPKLRSIQSYEKRSNAKIAANSAAILAGDPVSFSGGFVIKSVDTSGRIEGVATHDITAASDNQTVAKSTVGYVEAVPSMRLELSCSSASLAATDEGQYFNLTSAGIVDYATKSTAVAVVNTSDAGAATDPVIYKQVRLDKYVGQNTSTYSVVIPA
jgi:hypothetical protein